MEADEVLKLFDYCWFELKILKEKGKTLNSEANPDHGIEEEASKPGLSRIKTSHTRSMSDQLSSMASFKDDSSSPDSVLFQQKLQTILSGKEAIDPEAESENPPQIHSELLPEKKIARRRRKKRGSKSLSDLEFEELKGFMDLGFVFSEEDKHSSLASIIPGLQRLGKKNEDDDEEEEEGDYDECAVPRPYLSEAWEVLDRRKKEDPLLNWRIPALNSETDIKDSLRWWAHTVASTVIS